MQERILKLGHAVRRVGVCELIDVAIDNAIKNACLDNIVYHTLDFFLWGFVKDHVFRTKVTDIQDLKKRIRNAFERVTMEMLGRTWQEIEYRLDVDRATRGAHIDVYE
ncbi:hypothetical protein PR048_001366 [Dryococelus australis]|uniref:Uncharacterized protein n=1 Tax=Dryococelus australis TaxID=614101 RepID=A0ABQ9IH55_9NEOP|nr:hypothetical protein PR048_001366 [Dryococelus australis]